MEIPHWLEKTFHHLVDFWFAAWPQPVPEKDRLRSCKLISHRGEHDNRRVFENTLTAFERVRRAGVWGIEFDVRWTKDHQPIVIHDLDLMRVYGIDREVNRMSLPELQALCPSIPSLAKVIRSYGGQVHLMIELKSQASPAPAEQSRLLQEHLSRLKPRTDYHLLSLTPAVLEHLDWCPRAACLPIAQLNLKALSRLALYGKFGGINGHYLFITKALLKQHLRHNQQVGVGYVRSRNSLFREINRGVEWIYSNHALRMQRIVNGLLNSAGTF